MISRTWPDDPRTPLTPAERRRLAEAREHLRTGGRIEGFEADYIQTLIIREHLSALDAGRRQEIA